MTGVKFIVQEITSIEFIWQFRTILRIIGETLAAYRIGKVKQRDQLFSDGTGRLQTALQNFFIGVINEDCLCPLISPNSIILEGETSEHQVDAVLSTIAVCGKQLQRWAEVLEH